MQIAVVPPAIAAAPLPPAAVAAAPAPRPGVDGIVADMLPRVPGLPDWSTPGTRLGDLLGPPKPGSAAAVADMAAVKGAQLLRTPEGDAWAVKLAKEGATTIWNDFARRHREQTGTVAGWLDTALLAGTIAANAAVTQVAKRRYDRQRPYEVDPSIKPPVKLPHDSSYPSGHASSAFAAARVISVLQPTLAKEAYSLASQVALSRVYAGVHFPSDVVAGALLGTAVAESALRRAGKTTNAAPET